MEYKAVETRGIGGPDVEVYDDTGQVVSPVEQPYEWLKSVHDADLDMFKDSAKFGSLIVRRGNDSVARAERSGGFEDDRA